MNGNFQPSQAVTVKAIATMLGASVMPARDAMNIAEGALALRPNRTVIVPLLSRRRPSGKCVVWRVTLIKNAHFLRP